MSSRVISNNVTALILAGGKSRRMKGIDKTIMEFEGKPLINHMLDLLTPLFNDVIIAAGHENRFKDIHEIKMVSDHLSGVGPLAGIRAGMAECKTDWLFVVAADMPFIQPRLVIETIESIDSNIVAVVPAFEDKYEPLHAAYHRSLIDDVDAMIDSGRRKVLKLLEGNPVRWLPIDENDVQYFKNINRPEDLPPTAFSS